MNFYYMNICLFLLAFYGSITDGRSISMEKNTELYVDQSNNESDSIDKYTAYQQELLIKWLVHKIQRMNRCYWRSCPRPNLDNISLSLIQNLLNEAMRKRF